MLLGVFFCKNKINFCYFLAYAQLKLRNLTKELKRRSMNICHSNRRRHFRKIAAFRATTRRAAALQSLRRVFNTITLKNAKNAFDRCRRNPSSRWLLKVIFWKTHCRYQAAQKMSRGTPGVRSVSNRNPARALINFNGSRRF